MRNSELAAAKESSVLRVDDRYDQRLVSRGKRERKVADTQLKHLLRPQEAMKAKPDQYSSGPKLLRKFLRPSPSFHKQKGQGFEHVQVYRGAIARRLLQLSRGNTVPSSLQFPVEGSVPMLHA